MFSHPEGAHSTNAHASRRRVAPARPHGATPRLVGTPLEQQFLLQPAQRRSAASDRLAPRRLQQALACAVGASSLLARRAVQGWQSSCWQLRLLSRRPRSRRRRVLPLLPSKLLRRSSVAGAAGELRPAAAEEEHHAMPSFGLPQKSIFLVVFLHLLGFTMGGPILPALRSHFDLEAGQTGLITSAFPLGVFVAVFIFPTLSDVIGRKPVLVVSYAGVGTFFLLQALALHFGLSFRAFLALRVAAGTFAGATTVVKAYIADTTSRELLPKAMAYREAAGTLSYIVGPTLGGLIFSVSNVETVILASGLTSLMASLWVSIFLRGMPKPGAGAAVPSGGTAPATGPGDSAQCAAGGSKAGEASLPWVTLTAMVSIHFLYNIGQSFFDGFFALLCAERFGWQPSVLGPVLTALACLVFFNNAFMYPRLVRYFRLMPVATSGIIAVTCGITSLGIFSSGFMMAVSVFLYSFGISCFTPCVPTVLARLAPQRFRGRVLGFDAAISAMARIISPAAMGALYQLGAAAAFRCAGSFVFAGTLLMFWQQARLRQV